MNNKALKILYVVARPLEINTSSSIRNQATVKGLVENGYKIDLITSKPDRNHINFDESLNIKGVNCRYIELGGVQKIASVGRKIKVPSFIKTFILRIIQKRTIYDNLYEIVNHVNEVENKDYDYIISSSDPKSSHAFVDKLIDRKDFKFKGRWIQIWGDPFMNDITIDKNINKEEVFKEEKRLLKKADKIVYVSKQTLLEQKEKFSESAAKMFYYPIPYLKEIISPNRDLSQCNNIKLAYCGDYISSVRNIKPLYNAIRECDNLELTVAGNSDLKLHDSHNIRILPRQSHNTVAQIEDECDILIHLSNLYGSQIPGKIYQYAGTNKPILFILDGNWSLLKKEFSKYERFYFSDNDEKSIIATIKQIVVENRSFGPIADFAPKNISKQILIEW